MCPKPSATPAQKAVDSAKLCEETALQRTWRIWSIAFVAALILSGCRQNPTVWRTELRSPNGAWTATVHTDQYGGFGSGYIDTTVSLKRMDGTINRGKPFDILEYPNGGPIHKAYRLSDDNAGGGVDLKMKWLSNTHLEIDYSGTIDPDLQVVRFGGVEITLHQS